MKKIDQNKLDKLVKDARADYASREDGYRRFVVDARVNLPKTIFRNLRSTIETTTTTIILPMAAIGSCYACTATTMSIND